MSLYQRAGLQFEATKQSILAGREAAYVCRYCEETVPEDHARCPHCDEATVESLD